MDRILVFDIGTTSLKSAVFDASAQEAGSVSVSYETSYPAPGRAEQDPGMFWSAAVQGVRLLKEKGCLEGGELAAIGLAGHMNGCLPVDAEGQPTHPELIHSDSRSDAQCGEILSRISAEELYRRTGNRPAAHLSLPKMLWIKHHEPEAYKRTAWFLNSKDYLRCCLTGVLGETDFSDGSLTGALLLEQKDWDRELLKEIGLDPGKFPSLQRSTETAGTLCRRAAGVLELPQGIPVSYGGGDAACATRGAGVCDSSKAYASIGSSAWVSTLTKDPVLDEHMRMQHFFDLDGRRFNVCGTVQSAGIAVDWVLGVCADGRRLSGREYREIEASLAEIPPGSEGIVFLPYLMGERTPHWDAQARGAFVGFSLFHGRNELIRSVYEGVAFALRDCIEIYAQLDIPISEITLLGGGIRSRLWQEIICNVMNIPMGLHRMPTHAASLGAAMAAGTAAGIWKDLDAASAVSLADEHIEPNSEASRVYRNLYRTYSGMYERLQPVYSELAALRAKEER